MTFDLGKFMGGGPDPQLMEAINEATRGSISNGRRIRMIEDKLTKLINEFDLLTSNNEEESKKLEKGMRTISMAMEQLREQLDTSIKEIKFIHAAMGKLAQKEKVEELESFVRLVNPTQLLTTEDVERIVRKILEEREDRG